jgi:bifunctional non-homologous end joining protein LigD
VTDRADPVPRYAPMLASPWPEPFIDSDWVFELKWDGIRGIVAGGPGRPVSIRSRAGNDLSDRYPELTAYELDRTVVLDGEIVALDSVGRPSFEALQQRMGRSGVDAARVVPVSFAAFDVLYDAFEVIGEPWTERRRHLESLDLGPPFVVSSAVPGDPTALWELVERREFEGIVAKRMAAPYRPGVRSPDWRKIARFKRIRAVVGGYLPGEAGRCGSLGSLLLGLWHDDRLRWIGAVGSGFAVHELAAIRAALDEMRIRESPFGDTIGIPRDAVWVQPNLVALVQFREFTSAGRLRGPSFKGFTADDARSITWEREGPAAPGG